MHTCIPNIKISRLVENAIKHGISNLVHGGTIIIETKKEDSKVVISVSNSGKIGEAVDTGIGIENTKRRLALQFKDSAEFELFERDNMVIAQLTFTH